MAETNPTNESIQLSEHLKNVAQNLALIADLGYASVLLVVPKNNELYVVDAMRTTTAVGPEVAQLIGTVLPRSMHQPYATFEQAETQQNTKPQQRNGIPFVSVSAPVVNGDTCVGVIVREIALAVYENPGTMEQQFMDMVDDLVDVLSHSTLRARSGELFSTNRRPGDGVMRISPKGQIVYPSPNAVAIMRRAGYEQRVRTSDAVELPGGGWGIAPVIGTTRGVEREVQVVGRTLLYRSIGLGKGQGAIVLVEDITEAKRQSIALQVKDVTIKEVHHRVKNNLQTVASLLRMQARRVQSDEAKLALQDAMDRVACMATVHAMLSNTDGEMLDFLEVTRAVAEPIRAGYAGDASDVEIAVSGEANILLAAPVAMSLAMVLTELIHNAFEHGIDTSPDKTGHIDIDFSRIYAPDGERLLKLSVTDSGPGFPEGFTTKSAQSLGLSIIDTVVTADLGGTIDFSNTPEGSRAEVIFSENIRTKQY